MQKKTHIAKENYSKVISSDRFQIAYPGSGSTWFSRLLADLIMQEQGIDTTFEITSSRYRNIVFSVGMSIDVDDEIEHRIRIIKSHDFEAAVTNKFAYIFRWPDDAIFSHYRFMVGNGRLDSKITSLDEFAKRRIPSWMEHVNLAIKYKHSLETHVPFLSYEQMHLYPIDTLVRIVEFFQINVSVAQIEKALNNQNAQQIRTFNSNDNKQIITSNLRSGVIGSSFDKFNEENKLKIENELYPLYMEALKSSVLEE